MQSLKRFFWALINSLMVKKSFDLSEEFGIVLCALQESDFILWIFEESSDNELSVGGFRGGDERSGSHVRSG